MATLQTVYVVLCCSLLGVFVAAADECDEPPKLASATMNDSSISTFPVGTIVTYVCRPGYIRVPGSKNTITCQANLAWTEVQIKCEAKSCGPLPEVLNGRIEYDPDTKFGSVAHFFCNEGYNIIGRSDRNCLADGWDHQNPTCEPVICDAPPQITDGDFQLGTSTRDITFGTVVTYKCKKGQLVGEKSIHCTSSGTWSGPAPSCRDIACPNLEVDNGQKVNNFGPKYTYRDSVSFKCNTGYKMIGSSVITCNENGTWDPSPPTCELPKLPTVRPELSATSTPTVAGGGDKDEKPQTSTPTWKIVLPIVVVLFIIASIIGIYYYYTKKKDAGNYKTQEGKVSPEPTLNSAGSDKTKVVTPQYSALTDKDEHV